MDVPTILALYSRGLFPMDEPGSADLPWWAADPRTIFELTPPARAATRRVVRRSLRVAGRTAPPWRLDQDRAFDAVIAACARPRDPDDGVWLTPRMHALYRTLHAAGHCHTVEVWASDRLAAGLVAVTLGRAAMLESMMHVVPHAGNVLVTWTLDALAAGGFVLCDVQTPTPHTLRLGAREIPRAEYEARLRVALA